MWLVPGWEEEEATSFLPTLRGECGDAAAASSAMCHQPPRGTGHVPPVNTEHCGEHGGCLHLCVPLQAPQEGITQKMSGGVPGSLDFSLF